MNILITGGTGLVGKAVCEKLSSKGHSLRVLTRNPEKSKSQMPYNADFYFWDALSGKGLEQQCLQGVNAVLNLAGEPLAEGRWSEEKKQKIDRSRGRATRQLLDSVKAAGLNLDNLVSASAMGFYGDRGDEILTEKSSKGEGFLADVCESWEEPVREMGPQLSKSCTVLRISLVLSPDSGFLKEVLPLFKLGLGGPLGDGSQWMSWIHLNDLRDLIVEAVESPAWDGVINACSPYPVRNKEMTKQLGSVLNRPAFLPAPKFGLNLVFGEKANMLSASARMKPEKLEDGGFSFQYSKLQSALENLLQ